MIERGERVLRIPTHLTAEGPKARPPARQVRRRSTRSTSPAPRCRRAWTSFPAAHLDGPELDLRLLVDHRERLVRHRVELNSTLLWHLHDLWPELQLPGGALFSKKWATRIARRLARAEQTMRVRIARDELRRLRELTQTINRSSARSPQLVAADRAAAAHRARLRTADRGQARRRDRRRAALRHTGQARPRRRGRADPRQLGQHPAPTPRPGRQPPDQRRASPRHRHPRPLPPRDARLHRTPSPAKARPPAKRSAASSATSPATSGDCSSRPTRPRNTAITINFLT